MWDWIKTYSLYPLPHHLLSRLVLWATRQESRATPAAIRWFARKFDVDMKDAVEEELGSYTSFNRFFTRALKPEARPCLLYTSPSPRDKRQSRMPSSA